VTYQATVIADNPIHYWRLNEQPGAPMAFNLGIAKIPLQVDVAGLAIQSSVNILPGLFASNGFGWNGITSDGGGYAMNALSLAYRDKSTGLADTSMQIPVPGSIEAWVQINDWQAQPFVGFWMPGNPVNQQNLGLSFTHSSLIIFNGTNTSPATVATPGDTLYHHCIYAWTATQFFVFLDGVLSTSGSFTNSITNGKLGWFRIGSPQPGIPPFQQSGLASEVAVYGVALNVGNAGTHHAAADNRSVTPNYKGIVLPAIPPAVTGISNTVNHIGLTTTGEVVLTSNYAFGLTLTTIPGSYGSTVDTPTFYFDLGFISAVTANGVTATYRIERSQQFFVLPPFVTALSWSLAAGVVMTLSEFAATF